MHLQQEAEKIKLKKNKKQEYIERSIIQLQEEQLISLLTLKFRIAVY